MSEHHQELEEASQVTLQSNLAGVLLLRDQLLPNLLREEQASIMYWAGKELARHSPLDTYEEIIHFFNHVQFGSLTLLKETKNKAIFSLNGEVIIQRFQTNSPSFSLEAGFLAQQLQHQRDLYCEATFEAELKKKAIILTVAFDKKQLLDEQ